LRQAEKQQEELHKQRRAAEERQVSGAETVHDAPLRRQPADADQQAKRATERE